jgi:hypothetical protein
MLLLNIYDQSFVLEYACVLLLETEVVMFTLSGSWRYADK